MVAAEEARNIVVLLDAAERTYAVYGALQYIASLMLSRLPLWWKQQAL